MKPLHGLLQRLGVRPSERELFGLAGLCLALLGAAAFALLNTAETLFLKRVGVEALPVALLASAGLLVATTAGVGRLAARDAPRWLGRVLVGLALATLPFVLLADSRSPVVLGALMLVARQVLALGMLAFWLAMGSLVPTRRSKQLFAPLAAGVTLGGIAGSFASQPLALLLGTGGLIAFCVGLLVASAAIGMRLRHCGMRQLEPALRGLPGPRALEDAHFAELLRSNRLFRLLAVALFCGGVLSPVLYFEFASVLDGVTQGPDAETQLLGLYAQFRGWLNVAMLASQLWLSAVLYRHIGLPLSMALWPAAYALGFGWLGLDFALFAALATWGTATVAEDGISDSAARVLYNLFPESVRVQASGTLEGPVNRLGGVLGNSFVLGALAIGGVAWIGWVALPVALLWLASALVLWRAYPGMLLRASVEHGLAGAGVDRRALLDPSTLRSLSTQLLDPDPRVCRAAVDLVAAGEHTLVARLLAEAIEHAPAANRPLLVETLHRLVETLPSGGARSEAATDALARTLLARPPLPPELRADLVQIYARFTSDDASKSNGNSRVLLERALGDRAAPVRLAAIAELHRRGAPPPGLPDLDQTLTDALDASDALVRRAARYELRAMLLTSEPETSDEAWTKRLRALASHLDQRADRADTAEALRDVARQQGDRLQPVAEDAMRYLEDRDPRVRGALLCFAGHAGLASESSGMVSALGAREPEEAAGAREGLAALGPTATIPLLVALEFGSPRRRDAALSLLREFEVDADTLKSLSVRQLAAVQQAALQRAAVADLQSTAAPLLRRRLDERISAGLAAQLDLLASLHDDARLGELGRRLRRPSTGREHDLLIEAVEVLLGRGERDALVPLLESADGSGAAAAAARALGRSRPGQAQALSELCVSTDHATRRLAQASSLEGGGAIGDPQQMPSSIEIAVHLQGVPAFDRLSTPQLLTLAEILQEQKVSEGERIFALGEEGLGLYFVLEGEVELRRGRLVLEQKPAGSFFGELSAVDGVPRSEDAVATASTRLLRLDRDDLLALLEEAPLLAIGLAQGLSSRVRSLAERLEEAVYRGQELS